MKYFSGIVSYGVASRRTVKAENGRKIDVTLKCGANNTPAVYTKVSNYLPWIYKILNCHIPENSSYIQINKLCNSK